MENATEVNGHSIDISKQQNETIYDSTKYTESEKDSVKSTLNENNVNHKINNSNSTNAAVNPVKAITSDFVATTAHQLQFNENGKYSHRRNSNQPNLQPLLKKPINSIATTKPLILPAPISDSTKTNIVTMHSNYSTSSVTSQFNNCQQQMAMGIATIQPQHFGYSGISNNRYPMMPISLQNSYSTQQLTLANGGIGTAVQLMPVMNQTNNQLNNNRVQSVPLFMTPILGAHSGMLFQPNMTIVPQTSNTVQAISIPNSNTTSTYSNDYNPGITLQSPAMYSSAIRNPTAAIFTTEFEAPARPPDIEPTKAAIDKLESTVLITKTPKPPSNIIEPPATLVVRANVKHRELIRTQIYRMKPAVEESGLPRMPVPSEPETAPRLPSPIPVESESISLRNIEFEAESVEKIYEITEYKADKACEEEAAVNLGTKLVITTQTQTTVPERSPSSLPPQLEPVSLSTISNCSVESDNSKQIQIPVESKPTTPSVTSTTKRKLPSPEILSEPPELPRKLTKSFSVMEKSVFEPKSPDSLFEKLYKDIPERQYSVFTNSSARHSNKLTAVVRPEQRKILVHYLDDLIVFESDEPFPTSNKMQVVKSALKAGNIKLSAQKLKVLPDHFLYTNTDDETSSPNHQQRSVKPTFNSTLSLKTSTDDRTVAMETDEGHVGNRRRTDSCLEPLSIDIPTTNTTSSCGSVDSSQVRPLSVCSHRSPTPVPVSMRKPVAKETCISPQKKVDMVSPIVTAVAAAPPVPVPVEEKRPEKPPVVPVPVPAVTSVPKEPIPVKQVSPVKQKNEKTGLDRPICEWSVTDVADFVKQTPGCDNYVAMFQNHEIDGEALLLLSNDNLIQGALNMKIGPALKLCARIEKRKALDPPPPN